MTRYTDKTFRLCSKWCKVTRDNKKKEYTFALGDKGNFQAYYMEVSEFKHFPNWKSAENKAKILMQCI